MVSSALLAVVDWAVKTTLPARSRAMKAPWTRLAVAGWALARLAALPVRLPATKAALSAATVWP